MSVQLDPMTSTLLAGFGGAVVGAIATYLGATKIHKLSVRRAVQADFREVLLPVLMRIENRMHNSPYFILSDSTHQQLLAYYTFRTSVPWWQRRRFEKCWKEYFGDDFPHQYHENAESDEYCKEMFSLVEKRLKAVLRFAE